MEKFERLLLILFAILSLVTAIANIWNYKSIYSLLLILFVFVVNIVLFMLILKGVEIVGKVGKKKYVLFVFCMVLSFFLLWYLISSIFNIYYGSFVSLGGLLFMVGTQPVWMSILSLVGFLVIIFLLGIFLFSVAKKYPVKFSMRKEFYILGVIFLIFFIYFIPRWYLENTTPQISLIKGLIRPGYIGSNGEKLVQGEYEEILNFSSELENPNFVVILLESLSYNHVGYADYGRDVTPNIDKLAGKSIVFKEAYSSATHTDHAVPTFLSSRYTLTNRFTSNHGEDYPKTFMWDVLKKEGYNTAFFSPMDEDWMGIEKYYNKTNLDVFWDALTDGHTERGTLAYGLKDDDFNTTKKAIEWIDGLKMEESFFIYLNLQSTHYPYFYPEEKAIFLPDEPESIFTDYVNIAEEDMNASINLYDNALHYVDESVGYLISYLEDNCLMNNTVIILSSDHGETFDDRHENLRHGFGGYEAEIRVPLFFYIPDQKYFVVEERVRTLDVIPTILNIFGFQLSEHFQGRVMAENLPIVFYTQTQNAKIGLLYGDMKYFLNLNTYETEAYNLTLDPLEESNLIKDLDDTKKYAKEYGEILFGWYRCQREFYGEELWKTGELIDC